MLLCKLRHGKILCGRVFASFVETFNWLVDAVANVRGDADGDGAANGYIKVDRTDAAHPVIRFCAEKLPQGGGGVVTFHGNDSGSSTATLGSGSAAGDIYFASASDANVVVTVAQTSTTVVTATVGVYYTT